MTKGRTPFRACGPFLLVLMVMLAACGERTRPSAEESDQLDNAAEMLDSAANELESIDANELAPAENFNESEPQ